MWWFSSTAQALAGLLYATAFLIRPCAAEAAEKGVILFFFLVCLQDTAAKNPLNDRVYTRGDFVDCDSCMLNIKNPERSKGVFSRFDVPELRTVVCNVNLGFRNMILDPGLIVPSTSLQSVHRMTLPPCVGCWFTCCLGLRPLSSRYSDFDFIHSIKICELFAKSETLNSALCSYCYSQIWFSEWTPKIFVLDRLDHSGVTTK